MHDHPQAAEQPFYVRADRKAHLYKAYLTLPSRKYTMATYCLHSSTFWKMMQFMDRFMLNFFLKVSHPKAKRQHGYMDDLKKNVWNQHHEAIVGMTKKPCSHPVSKGTKGNIRVMVEVFYQ